MPIKTIKFNFSSIILAGGLSSRISSFKPLIKITKKTILEDIISIYKAAGIKNIYVITGHNASKIELKLKNHKIKIINNPIFNKGMFSSMQAGIKDLYLSNDYFFIHPVDIPLIQYQTIIELMNIAIEKKADIIYPLFDKKRGHPPLIRNKIKKILLKETNKDQRLDQYLKIYSSKILDIPVSNRGINLDLDTKEKYKKLILISKKKYLFPKKECQVLMKKIIKSPNKIIEHCQVVSNIASSLVKIINKNSQTKLDTALIQSSSLTHDILRTKTNHAKLASRLFKRLGYTKLSEAISRHMDKTVDEKEIINETEILYLADKLVHKNKIVKLHSRVYKKKQFCKKKYIKKNITKRIKNASIISSKTEKLILQKLKNNN